MRLFLTGVLTIITCLVIHAADTGGDLIFYGDAKVTGKENVFVYQDSSLKNTKTVKIKKNKVAPVTLPEDNIAKPQESTIVIPCFPFAPSSSSYFIVIRESATIAQQRLGGSGQLVCKACWGKAYPYSKNSDFSIYHPKQRQKLSIAAIQCGTLTSFGSNYPPALNTMSLHLS